MLRPGRESGRPSGAVPPLGVQVRTGKHVGRCRGRANALGAPSILGDAHDGADDGGG